MITPTEIRKKAENKYLTFLRSVLERQAFNPIVIVGNKKPNDDTAQFEKELTELIAHSKEKKGYGYSIEYQKVKTRKHGEQDIPVSISFLTEQDYLKYIGKEQGTVGFRKDVERILSAFPEMRAFLVLLLQAHSYRYKRMQLLYFAYTLQYQSLENRMSGWLHHWQAHLQL